MKIFKIDYKLVCLFGFLMCGLNWIDWYFELIGFKYVIGWWIDVLVIDGNISVVLCVSFGL